MLWSVYNYTNDKLVIRMPVNIPIKQMIDWVTSQYVVKDIENLLQDKSENRSGCR